MRDGLYLITNPLPAHPPRQTKYGGRRCDRCGCVSAQINLLGHLAHWRGISLVRFVQIITCFFDNCPQPGRSDRMSPPVDDGRSSPGNPKDRFLDVFKRILADQKTNVFWHRTKTSKI